MNNLNFWNLQSKDSSIEYICKLSNVHWEFHNGHTRLQIRFNFLAYMVILFVTLNEDAIDVFVFCFYSSTMLKQFLPEFSISWKHIFCTLSTYLLYTFQLFSPKCLFDGINVSILWSSYFSILAKNFCTKVRCLSLDKKYSYTHCTLKTAIFKYCCVC